MKSRTSSSKRSALGKDITRFWPAWALYLVGILLILLSRVRNENPDGLIDFLAALSLVNMGYALVCAMLLFGDLYSPRLCYALHAMPLRRGSWFTVHCRAGFLFSFAPNLLCALVLLPRMGYNWPVVLFWLAGMQLEYTFFFGLAVLCAFCVGSRFALTMLYSIFNFLGVLVGWYIDTLFMPLLSGVPFRFEALFPLSPVIYMSDNFTYSDMYYDLLPIPDTWLYLLVTAAIGAGLLLVAMLLYRRRDLECAGDFIVVRPLRPVFCLLFTFTTGTLFYLFNDIFLGGLDEVMLLIGIIIGFFACQMLQKRTVRVFRWKTVLACAALIACSFGSLWLTAQDPAGITRYVPPVQEIKGVEISNGWHYYYNEDHIAGYDITSGSFTDPEAITDIRAAHQAMIGDGSYRTEGTMPITILYHLSDGSYMARNYLIDSSTPTAQALKPYFSDPICVFGGLSLPNLLEKALHISVDYVDKTASLTGEDTAALIKALWADCEAGNMARQEEYHDLAGLEDAYRHVYWVGVDIHAGPGLTRRFDLCVYPDAENTMAFLEEKGLLYEDPVK